MSLWRGLWISLQCLKCLTQQPHCSPYVSSLSFAEVFWVTLSFPRLHVRGTRQWIILQSRKGKTVRCQRSLVTGTLTWPKVSIALFCSAKHGLPAPSQRSPHSHSTAEDRTWGKAMLVCIKTNTYQEEHRKWELQTSRILNLQLSAI